MPDLTPLRNLTEDGVEEALEGAYVGFPLQTPADLVEAVKKVVEHFYGEVET